MGVEHDFVTHNLMLDDKLVHIVWLEVMLCRPSRLPRRPFGVEVSHAATNPAFCCVAGEALSVAVGRWRRPRTQTPNHWFLCTFVLGGAEYLRYTSRARRNLHAFLQNGQLLVSQCVLGRAHIHCSSHPHEAEEEEKEFNEMLEDGNT